MTAMNYKHCLPAALLATAFFLAGCAAPSPTAPEPQSTDSTAAAPETATAPAETPPPPPAAQPRPRLPEDGIVAQFKPAQVKLSDETLALLANLVETRAADERLEITGYCNRQDAPEDAREIALKRAMAVRQELLRLGVPAKSIRVKYSTVQALHAVKIITK